MTRLSIFKTFFPFFFFLLFLSACHKPSIPTKVAAAPTSSQTPTTPDASETPITREDPIVSKTPTTSSPSKSSGRRSGIPNPDDWENLTRTNPDWIQIKILATVTNTEGDKTQISFPINTGASPKHLIFKPQSGDYHSISSSSERHGDPNSVGIHYKLHFPPEISQPSGKLVVHTYFNGQYLRLDTEYDYYVETIKASIRPFYETYTLKPTDTWYFILIFVSADGTKYQYRTPDMSIANAN